MSMLPAPPNFRITNLDTSPTRKVRLEWGSYSAPELAVIQVAGFRVFRSVTPGFTATGEAAGQGNCIADETTLGPTARVFDDGVIPAYGVYYYEIQTIGRFGYGVGQYGDGAPYGSPTL